ncbi:uncharacterized protein BO87DRAFT_357386 [Aspergillus neoniger CBS 115656]|uniref:Uncharacterized protein n=1 Tax=Aspergillus neoniger (strain CBS 115656) TaxID=1448310 RepID=A0A318YLR9_ASPNB|nr:hypothetical protein BO87DRAFT_357386 [Aspergillus neoniger CBS 115656]PYH35156.1 hypothetical protein BO87DRAFT_357386 [Aspergillus neoniger CBS 115656]
MESASQPIEYVECRHPLFDVEQLEEPAETDQLCGKRIKTLTDILLNGGRGVYDKLLDFHGWGYKYNTDSHSSLQPRRVKVAILVKIIWNQAEYHQPKSVEELFNWGRDAGPRLLKQGCVQGLNNYLPISRRSPDPPRVLQASDSRTRGSVRSSGDIPEEYVKVMEKQLYKLGRLDEELLELATPQGDQTEEEQSECMESSTDNSDNSEHTEWLPSTSPEDQGVEDEMTDIEEEETSDRDEGDPMEECSSGGRTPTHTIKVESPATQHEESFSESRRPSEQNTEGVSDPNTTTSTSQQFRRAEPLPNQHAQLVTEAVQRAVMKFAYHELERHQTAAPLDMPRPWLTANLNTMNNVQYSLHPVTAEVELHAPNNPRRPRTTRPYRGRGPVSTKLSESAIGCAIIAGRLLDAGSTNIDRKQPGWQDRFTGTDQAFIEGTDAQWDFLDRETSLKLVECFASFLPANAQLATGPTQAMRTVWRKFTRNFDQFAYSYNEKTTAHCDCGPSRDSRTTVNGTRLTTMAPPVLETDRNGVSMEEVLSRVFDPQRQRTCIECNRSVNYERRFNNVPMRLVVELGPNVSIRSHTKDITLSYHDNGGEGQRVTYRWIGGIYSPVPGFLCLLWNGAERGVHCTNLCSYESHVHDGAILGLPISENGPDQVPERFWRNQQIPLLFYEQVLNPSLGELQVAVSAVSGMLESASQGELFLQQSPGWAPPELPPRQQNPYPWEPSTLPDIMIRFKRANSDLRNMLVLGTQPQAQPQAQPQVQLQVHPQVQRQEQAAPSRPRGPRAQPYVPAHPYAIMSMAPTPIMSADTPSPAIMMSGSPYVGGAMPPPPRVRPMYITRPEYHVPPASPARQHPPLHNPALHGSLASSPVAFPQQRVAYSPGIPTTDPPPSYEVVQAMTSQMQLTTSNSSAYGGHGPTMMGQSSSPRSQPQLPQPQLPPTHPENWVNRPGHHGPRH